MSDQIRCNGCGYSKPESEIVCLRCLATCKIELANLPILLRQADTDDFLQPKRSGLGGGSRSGRIPPGHDENTMDFVQGADLLGTLYAWQDLIRDLLGLEERLNLRGDVLAKVNNAVEFIQVHWEWFSTQSDFIGDFITEIRGLHARGMSITGQTQPKVTQIKCPADFREAKCDRKLAVDETDLDAIVQCKRCKTDWTTKRLILVALASPAADVWVDADSIAQYKNLSPNHVRKVAKKYGVPKSGVQYNLPKFIEAYEKSLEKVAK